MDQQIELIFHSTNQFVVGSREKIKIPVVKSCIFNPAKDKEQSERLVISTPGRQTHTIHFYNEVNINTGKTDRRESGNQFSLFFWGNKDKILCQERQDHRQKPLVFDKLFIRTDIGNDFIGELICVINYSNPVQVIYFSPFLL